MAGELQRQGVRFRKDDNAFLWVSDSKALQAAADRLSPENFIFRRNFPIHKIFERACELGVFRLTADQIAQIFGVRKHKRIRGKLHSTLEKLDHGHHVLRVYCKGLASGTDV